MWVLDAKGNRTGEMRPSKAPAEGDFRDQLLARDPATYPPPQRLATRGRAAIWSKSSRFPRTYATTARVPTNFYLPWHPPSVTFEPSASRKAVTASTGETSIPASRLVKNCNSSWNTTTNIAGPFPAALTRKDVPVDTTRWKQHSWFHRLDDAVADIIRIVPEHATVALVDGNTWDAPRAFGTRRLVPFMQQDGIDWGPPADSETAIAQLDELLSEQTQFLAVGWPCFWWFDEYPEFFKVLGRHSICRVCNNAVVIYELVPRTVTTNGASVPLNGNAEVDRYV